MLQILFSWAVSQSLYLCIAFLFVFFISTNTSFLSTDISKLIRCINSSTTSRHRSHSKESRTLKQSKTLERNQVNKGLQIWILFQDFCLSLEGFLSFYLAKPTLPIDFIKNLFYFIKLYCQSKSIWWAIAIQPYTWKKLQLLSLHFIDLFLSFNVIEVLMVLLCVTTAFMSMWIFNILHSKCHVC